jgi:hypothetical protein
MGLERITAVLQGVKVIMKRTSERIISNVEEIAGNGTGTA